MTMTTGHEIELDGADTPSSLRRVLLSIIAVAALIIGVGAGYLWGNSGSSGPSFPAVGSADVGFAEDMSVHHQQAIDMAGYARDNSTNSAIVRLAFDIETSQSVEMGTMLGWLQTWGAPRVDPNPMSWMAGHAHLTANGLMPGMATPTQEHQLLTSHGDALNILFLQLMIHHHQGGVEMAQYAYHHAKTGYEKTLAGNMFAAQSNEIVQMEQMLRQLGGTELPPPTD